MLCHDIRHFLTFNMADFRRYPELNILTPADVGAAAPEPDEDGPGQS
jgi:hypothetical protein